MMNPRESPVQALASLSEKNGIPLNVMLELTYRCNERCLHCYLPETQGLRAPRVEDELAFPEWSRVLGEMAEAGTFGLKFSGGEVLLRKDFDAILRRARELTFAVEIFTNAALLTPRKADLWAQLGVAGVGVSVYSPEAPAHDRVTRLEGSFEATMRGVRLLAERDITVDLKTPMMKLNLDGCRDLVALAREMGVGCKFDPVLTGRNDGSDIPVRLGLDEKGLARVYSDGRLVAEEDVLRAGVMDLEASTCGAGRTSAAIGPYGDVVPCIQWAASGGNVREKAFGDIWSSGEIFKTARRLAAKDVKVCPACGEGHFTHCLGLGELEKGDPLIPDSRSCRITAAMKDVQSRRAGPAGQTDFPPKRGRGSLRPRRRYEQE